MKRVAACAGLLVLSSAGSAGARSTFDPGTASLALPPAAALAIDFERPESLAGLDLATWDKSAGFPQITRRPITGAADVASMLTSAPEDAVEGSHALRLGQDGTGILIKDAALFARLAGTRLEASVWARGDGSSLTMQVFYDPDPDNIYAPGKSSFATVRAIRTGRATSDGWAEYSTGPIDGNVWGVPIRGIALLPSYYAEATESVLVDAFDLTTLDGAPTKPAACTQQTVDTVCGPQGDCMFGHCVSSSVTWGALPPLAHRRAIADRWIFYSTRLFGDRGGVTRGVDILTPAARSLAETAVSSRQFFGGMNRLVNLLRDNHTSFGSPANFTNFAPQIAWGSSSALGACFGVVDKDLLGGGLGYAVFRAGNAPVTGVALRRGDVLFAIDGREAKAWLDDNWPRFATTLPSDPASDWGPSANDLSRLVSMRASTVTVIRCASSTACGPGDSQTITVDVAGPVFQALVGEAPIPNDTFGCTQRFSNSVDVLAGGAAGEDAVSIETGAGGETRVQFDGFVGQTKWPAAMRSVFTPRPERVLMDARMGHGGYFDTVQTLFDLLRSPQEPMGVLAFGRGTYDLVDPPWLFDRLTDCSNGRADQWTCLQGNAIGFFTSNTDPPGGAAKIAWLNTSDVSANDFMPRLLQGRSGFRIFAPHATSGAFGSITELPGIASGWSGGSLQVQDSRFAPNRVAATTARWESGHGVAPDEVVAEKLSDALAGVDTMLQAATTWLASP